MDIEESVPPDVHYKCHPRELVKAVICVICSAAFHRIDFNKRIKNGAVYLTETLALCELHKGLNLITDLNLDEKDEANVKRVFTGISETNKVLQSACNGLKQSLEKIQEENNRQKTKLEVFETENRLLNEQLDTLKELNSALKDKNELQEIIIKKIVNHLYIQK